MQHHLVTDPAPVLHQKAARVADPLAPNIQGLIDDMIAVMRAEKGIGLAAPQVAAQERICVFDIGGTNDTPLVCINPTIVRASRTLVMSEEGCLSLPGLFIPIVRAEHITVRFIDREGNRHTRTADDLLAIAFQHEIDHLDGILMIDRHAAQETLRAQFTMDTAQENTTHRIG